MGNHTAQEKIREIVRRGEGVTIGVQRQRDGSHRSCPQLLMDPRCSTIQQKDLPFDTELIPDDVSSFDVSDVSLPDGCVNRRNIRPPQHGMLCHTCSLATLRN